MIFAYCGVKPLVRRLSRCLVSLTSFCTPAGEAHVFRWQSWRQWPLLVQLLLQRNLYLMLTYSPLAAVLLSPQTMQNRLAYPLYDSLVIHLSVAKWETWPETILRCIIVLLYSGEN